MSNITGTHQLETSISTSTKNSTLSFNQGLKNIGSTGAVLPGRLDICQEAGAKIVAHFRIVESKVKVLFYSKFRCGRKLK